MRAVWNSIRLMERLSRDAEALSSDLCLPVDLNLVGQRLGLRISWGERQVLPAEGRLLRGPQGWTVAVAASDRHRPRARFTMAHEIGHYLLESYGAPRPVTEGDYWRTEALCHYFAGQLLVPRSVVLWVGQDAGSGPSEVLRRAALAAERSRVSPQAMSHRLSQDLDYCAYCEVSLKSPNPRVSGVVSWIIEKFSWLGVRDRSHVKAEHFLASALHDLRRLEPSQIQTRYLNGLPAAALRRKGSIWLLGLEPALLEQHTNPHAWQLTLPSLPELDSVLPSTSWKAPNSTIANLRRDSLRDQTDGSAKNRKSTTSPVG